MGDLCKAYWYPLYGFLRRSGHAVQDAQDITQDFFVRLMDGRLLQSADPARGKFRTLLLSALRQAEVDGWRAANAEKRGANQIISLDGDLAEAKFQADDSPHAPQETMFDRAWARALMDRSWERLQQSYDTPELARVFAELAPRLSGANTAGTLADVGVRLGMNEDAVKKAFSRMRNRFGHALRQEAEETTGSREAAQQELSHLLQLFS